MQNCGYSQNKQNIDDIATDDVADRNIRRLLDRARNGHGKLGRARPERNDRKSDDERGNFTLLRNARAPVNKPIRALYKERESQYKQKYLKKQHTL